MSNPLNDLLGKLLSDFTAGIRISEDRRTVRVRLLRFTNFELIFSHPDPKRIAAAKKHAREVEGHDRWTVQIPIKLINRKSGKEVRGFDHSFINPWWLRRSAFEFAAAVAWMEREWDVMSDDFIAMMEAQDREEQEA